MSNGASVETLREFVDMFNAFIMENLEFRIVWSKIGKYKEGYPIFLLLSKRGHKFHFLSTLQRINKRSSKQNCKYCINQLLKSVQSQK